MSWIAKLDTRATRWPIAGRWSYLAVKWYLITTGAMALGGVVLDRIGIWSLY